MYKRSSPSIVFDEDGPDGGSDAGSHTSGGSQNSGEGKRSSLQIDSLTVPVIKSYGSRDSSRNSSTERKPKDGISDQLKDALGGGVPKSSSSTDLPTITGRKPLPRALQPKDPNARRPSYQPIIAGPFAFTSSTGLGATTGTAAGGRANLQNRRSSVSTCFPLRTGYRDPDVKTADVIATKYPNSIGNRTSLIDTRRGSEVLTAPLFGGAGRKKSETTQDSIHSLLRDVLGKKTPFMEEESSQNVVLRNAGRQSPAIRTNSRPSSTSENTAPINRHIKEDRLIFQRTPPKIEDFKSELLHAASKPDARVRDDEIVPATSPTFESKPLKQVSPPEISSEVVQERGRLQIKSTSSSSGRLSKVTPMSPTLDSSSPSFRSVPNQQADWYNAIPSSPRRSISISASPRMSVGSTSAYPVTSEVRASGSFRTIDQTSTPYSDYLSSQMSRNDDDDAFAPSIQPLQQHHQQQPTTTTTSKSSDKEDEDDVLPPPPLPDSLPPLPDSLPPMLDHFGMDSTDDAALTTGQHNHQQTNSFSTEDSGLDRMDCTNPGYDELNERREARNCFSSREDLSCDGRDSLVGSPHPGEMIRGLASPTGSDADSGIGSAKYERRRIDGNRDFQQIDPSCNGEEKIMYRLLSEKNITKDDWSEISKTPDYGSKKVFSEEDEQFGGQHQLNERSKWPRNY